MDSQPYKLVCNSELALISRRLGEAWGSWCEHWLLGAKPDSVVCVSADQDRNTLHGLGRRWRRFAGAQGTEFRVAVDDMLPGPLAGLAFGSWVPRFEALKSGPSGLLADLIDVMLGDLAVRVFRAAGQSMASVEELEQDVSEPDATVWKRGSGAVSATIAIGGEPLHALLSEPMVRAMVRELPPPLKPREAPSPRRACLGAQKVQLELWTGETQIELGMLESLAPGDVILLDLKISEPFRLAVDGNLGNRSAHLGRSGERKALQLLPANRIQ
jgi:flagellar motor switch/type III secretory pathway protein FliN